MSSKIITFLDLAGHQKYLKTTIFGLTGHIPDYAMLVIAANAGVGMSNLIRLFKRRLCRAGQCTSFCSGKLISKGRFPV